jgi:hypothetical protein
MDCVRGVRTSQDQRPEGHTKAGEPAMVVMDCLSQNQNLNERLSGSSGGYVQSDGWRWWWGVTMVD